jgi:hypothetical protein
MASRPMGKGQKHKMSYSDVAWAPDNTAARGQEDERASTSQVAATTTQSHEWMTLRSGNRVEQKRTTEMLLGLTIEGADKVMTKSPEVRAKTEESSIEGGYKGLFRKITEEVKGIEPSQRRTEGGGQTPTNEELRRRRLRMLMIEEEEDEVLEHIIKPLTSRLMDRGPDPGYSTKRWLDCVRHLGYPSVYTGDGPLIETLQRSEPPQGQEKESWKIFINRIVKEVAGIMRAATTTPKEKSQPSQEAGLVPSMPDMLKLAEQSLMLPKQEDESNSTV